VLGWSPRFRRGDSIDREIVWGCARHGRWRRSPAAMLAPGTLLQALLRIHSPTRSCSASQAGRRRELTAMLIGAALALQHLPRSPAPHCHGVRVCLWPFGLNAYRVILAGVALSAGLAQSSVCCLPWRLQPAWHAVLAAR
jgi:hypothetical protein